MKTIQVTGTGTANKGVEVLLIAIQQQLASALPDAKLAVTPGFGSFDDRARYGLRTVLRKFSKADGGWREKQGHGVRVAARIRRTVKGM
jgi:hypothetical protein